MLFQLQAQNRSAKEVKTSSEVIYLSGQRSLEYRPQHYREISTPTHTHRIAYIFLWYSISFKWCPHEFGYHRDRLSDSHVCLCIKWCIGSFSALQLWPTIPAGSLAPKLLPLALQDHLAVRKQLCWKQVWSYGWGMKASLYRSVLRVKDNLRWVLLAG